eukprot:1158304-Pelagomonas_calceolata.AAC.8
MKVVETGIVGWDKIRLHISSAHYNEIFTQLCTARMYIATMQGGIDHIQRRELLREGCCARGAAVVRVSCAAAMGEGQSAPD